MHIIIYIKEKNLKKGKEKIKELTKKCSIPLENIQFYNNDSIRKGSCWTDNICIDLFLADDIELLRGQRYQIGYFDNDISILDYSNINAINGVNKITENQFF